MKSLLAGLLLSRSAAGPSLLYVGDWGGDGDRHPTTAAQVTAASGMSKVAKDLGVDGVLLLGDNFYNSGVKDVDSARFNATFENVYAPQLFGDLPFHVIAGNHDHRGNVQAQIDYTARSGHWKFPSLYYKLDWRWTAADGRARSAEIVMIDTVELAGPSLDREGAAALTGPEDPESASEQWAWIERQLNASAADFLWVAGHYPIYSAGDDGTTLELVKRLLPLLRKYGAHYICGHDHLVQVLDMDGVYQFQNGMGMECCYDLKNLGTVPAGYIKYVISGGHAQGKTIGADKPPRTKGGFNSMEFGDDKVTISSHKEDGARIYSAEVPRRATPSRVFSV